MTNKVKFTLTRLPIDRCVNNEGQIPEVPANPRTLGKKEFERLKKKLLELDFTAARPLIAYPQGGQYVVFCGNQRLRALREIGETEINAAIVPEDMSAEELRKILLADNVSDGEWDTDMLANEEFSAEEAEWAGVEEAIWNTEGVEKKETQEDDFDEEKDKVETICKKGDIWQLGQHRLMCGDSTDTDAFAKLMNGEHADITFTSPPYNLIEGFHLHPDQKDGYLRGKNAYQEYKDNRKPADYAQFLTDVLNNCMAYSDDTFFNIGYTRGSLVGTALFLGQNAERFCGAVTWKKSGCYMPFFPVQHGMLGNITEPVYIFSNEAGRKLSHPQWKQGETSYNLIETKNASGNEFSKEHAATFPVEFASECISRFAENSVLDCFGGTGTTMIAAEQLGRKCYMMELDPHYCDVIIARWEKLTGQKACKL